MQIFQLLDNQQVKITLKLAGPSGKFEPLPKDTALTVTNSQPSMLSTEIGTDKVGLPALIAKALVPASESTHNITVTVTPEDESAGFSPGELEFTIASGTVHRGLTFDVMNHEATPQATPAAPSANDPSGKNETKAPTSKTSPLATGDKSATSEKATANTGTTAGSTTGTTGPTASAASQALPGQTPGTADAPPAPIVENPQAAAH